MSAVRSRQRPLFLFILYGAVVQLVRMPACHAGGRGFEPLLRRICAGVAQLAEQLICNQQVAGSNPITGLLNTPFLRRSVIFLPVSHNEAFTPTSCEYDAFSL